MPEYLIEYECPECGHKSQEVWDCPCDSECPACGCRDIQASDYRPLEVEQGETPAMDELKSINDVPELQDLQLVAVVCDGSTSLVSRKHRIILADAEKLAYDATAIPTVTLDENFEKAITQEVLHGEYEGSFPGWDALFTFLDQHPELLTP